MADWPTTDELARMARDDIGMLILRRLADTEPNNRHLRNFTFMVLNEVTPRPPYQVSVTTQQQMLTANPQASELIAFAWQWLINQGYLAPDMTQSSRDWVTVTDAGRAALQAPGAVRARELLGRDVDPALDSARRALESGDPALAVHSALRAVEIAVRAGATLPSTVHGVDVMVQAFRPGAPLADSAAPPGEQEGVMQLFRGAYMAFRNPASHRDVEYSDPAEAAEVILLANLLLRLTHRAVARASLPTT